MFLEWVVVSEKFPYEDKRFIDYPIPKLDLILWMYI